MKHWKPLASLCAILVAGAFLADAADSGGAAGTTTRRSAARPTARPTATPMVSTVPAPLAGQPSTTAAPTPPPVLQPRPTRRRSGTMFQPTEPGPGRTAAPASAVAPPPAATIATTVPLSQLSPPEQRRVVEPMIVGAVTTEMMLTPEQALKFSQAYESEREAARKQLSAVKDRAAMSKVTARNWRNMRTALAPVIGAESTTRALGILANDDFERSVSRLLEAGVNQVNLQQALPVVIRYHRSLEQLENVPRRKGQDLATMRQNLRQSTAKELAPIVGEKAAKVWAGATVTKSPVRKTTRGAR